MKKGGKGLGTVFHIQQALKRVINEVRDLREGEEKERD